MVFEILIALLLGMCCFISWDRKKKQEVFKKLGIPGPTPGILLGNQWDYLKGPSDVLKKWTKEYGETFGYFEGAQPVLVTSNLEIIKEVFIRQFNNFAARKPTQFGPDPDDKRAVSIPLARGHRWKRLRSTMSPIFSTNKLRQTTPLVMMSVKRLVEILEEKRQMDKAFNIMEVFQGLTMDVISSTAFGLDIDALRNPDCPFTQKCRAVFAEQNFSHLPLGRKIMVILSCLHPVIGHKIFSLVRLLQHLQIMNLPGLWLAEKAKEIIERRKNNEDEKRMDLLQIMLEAESVVIDDNALTMTEDDTDQSMTNGQANETKRIPTGVKVTKKITHQEMVSNIVVFLLAGYETTSTALSYTCHELALHPEVQTRIQEELDTQIGEAELDYQCLSKLHYLDMVLNEVLRKNPIAPNFVTRQCLEDVVIGDIELPVGMVVQVNMNEVHFDPEIWGPTDPKLFDPERFSTERKAIRHPQAFQAFGIGPRNCVGMRFALLEAKLALAEVLRNFTIERCAETEAVLETTEQTTVVPKNGVYVKLTSRKVVKADSC